MSVLFFFTTINTATTQKSTEVLLICLEADLYSISEPVAKDFHKQ